MRSRGLTNIVLPGPSKGRGRASRLGTLQLVVVQELTFGAIGALTAIPPSVLQIVLQSAADRETWERLYPIPGQWHPEGLP